MIQPASEAHEYDDLDFPGLTAAESKALAMYFDGRTWKEICKACSLHKDKWYEIRSSPRFAGACREYRRLIVHAAKHRIAGLISEALDVYCMALRGQEVKKHQFFAAKDLLDRNAITWAAEPAVQSLATITEATDDPWQPKEE